MKFAHMDRFFPLLGLGASFSVRPSSSASVFCDIVDLRRRGVCEFSSPVRENSVSNGDLLLAESVLQVVVVENNGILCNQTT